MDIEAEFVYADILRTLQSSILGQPSPSVSATPPPVAYLQWNQMAIRGAGIKYLPYMQHLPALHSPLHVSNSHF